MGSRNNEIGESGAVKIAKKISRQLTKLNKVMESSNPTVTTTTTL